MQHLACVLFITTISVIPHICSANCVLSKSEGRSKTSFVCQHGNLTEIPRNLDSQLTFMDLSYNKIVSLHESAFVNVGNLRKLLLNHNQLWKITDLAFSYLSHLEYLSLANNNLAIQISSLSPYAFTYLPRLQFLDLSSNSLGQLPAKFFSKLLNLKELRINHAVSGLKIEDGAFEGLNKLKILSLTKNNLMTLSSEHKPAFNAMNLEKLYLDGNIWKCDCKLKWLRLWVQTKRMNTPLVTTRTENNIHNQPICTDIVSRNNDISMFNIKITSFQCQPKLLSKPSYVTALQMSNLTFSCLFYSDPKTYVKWYKGNTLIGDHWNRMIRKTSNGHFFTANLTIVDLQLIDEGVYICETGNDRGNVSTNHTLVVKQIYMGKLKLDKVVILVGIGALGLIVLLASIGIIIYCFYGRDAMKANNVVNRTNNSAGVIQNNALKHQQVPLLPPHANAMHQRTLLDGVPDMHVDDYLSHPNANEHNAVVKRLLANGAIESMQNSSGSNSLLRNDMSMALHLPLDSANSQRSESLSPTNEDCPVHGPNRSNFSACPVHGHNQDIHDPCMSPFVNYNSDSYGKSSNCPVHSAEEHASHMPNDSIFMKPGDNPFKTPVSSYGHEQANHLSSLQPHTMNSSDHGFMRASTVDDCVTTSSAVLNGTLYNEESAAGLFITSGLSPESDGTLSFLKPISKRQNDPDTVV